MEGHNKLAPALYGIRTTPKYFRRPAIVRLAGGGRKAVGVALAPAPRLAGKLEHGGRKVPPGGDAVHDESDRIET
eukprot:6567556-Prymnesium_polylepis.1